MNTEKLNRFELSLVNLVQRGFPLCTKPFALIAKKLKVDEKKVIETFKNLAELKVLSRIGPVFKPNTIGASSLVAFKVLPANFDYVANIVSSFESVNHNYARTHEYNLWFVVAAGSGEELAREISSIEEAVKLEALVLPLEKEYYIDLGFQMKDDFGALNE